MSDLLQSEVRAMQLRHLEETERHVAEAERHIAEQEQRIVNLARLGHDLAEAKILLENFNACQVLHIQHRDRIRTELEP